MAGRPPRGKGRPKGAKNKVSFEVRMYAQSYGAEAIDALVKVMRGIGRTKGEQVSPASRVYAASIILDRGYGKAPQAVTGEGGSGPVTVEITEHLYPVAMPGEQP